MGTTNVNRSYLTHNTSHGQWSINQAKGGNQKELHHATCTTGQSPMKFGRECYSNLQESLQMNISRGQRQLPNATVGQVTSTNYTHIESTPTIKCGPNSIGILICPWQFWLQQNATGSSWMCSPTLRKQCTMRHMGGTLYRRLVHWESITDATKSMSRELGVSESQTQSSSNTNISPNLP